MASLQTVDIEEKAPMSSGVMRCLVKAKKQMTWNEGDWAFALIHTVLFPGTQVTSHHLKPSFPSSRKLFVILLWALNSFGHAGGAGSSEEGVRGVLRWTGSGRVFIGKDLPVFTLPP